MFTPEGKRGHNIGNFEHGKTFRDNFYDGGNYNKDDIMYAERHVVRLAESFIKGSDELKKYYKKTSRYYGQGFNENWKFIRLDDHSAIREKQFNTLMEQRKKFEHIPVRERSEGPSRPSLGWTWSLSGDARKKKPRNHRICFTHTIGPFRIPPGSKLPCLAIFTDDLYTFHSPWP